VAEPTLSKPWFMGRNISLAIFWASRAFVVAGATFNRFKMRSSFPSRNSSRHTRIHHQLPSRNGVGFWNLLLAIRSKSPFSGRPEFASVRTITRDVQILGRVACICAWVPLKDEPCTKAHEHGVYIPARLSAAAYRTAAKEPITYLAIGTKGWPGKTSSATVPVYLIVQFVLNCERLHPAHLLRDYGFNFHGSLFPPCIVLMSAAFPAEFVVCRFSGMSYAPSGRLRFTGFSPTLVACFFMSCVLVGIGLLSTWGELQLPHVTLTSQKTQPLSWGFHCI